MKIKVIDKGGEIRADDFEYAPGYVFTTDPACVDYDWLVVFDEFPKEDRGTFRNGCEELRCPRERTILCTWEPVSVKAYSRAYTRQFGHYLSNRPWSAERHPHYHLGRGYYIWYVDRPYAEVVAKTDYPKDKVISAVCSAKRMRHTAHHFRYALIDHLMRTVPGLDWYGRKFRPIDRKYRLLDGYKYHLAVENHIAPNHWSEKLSDPLLCECLPFYAGDPEVGRILPPESFIPIPIDDPAAAERIIKTAIANGEYEKRLPAIREARRLLIAKYNFWAQVIAVIEESAGQAVSAADPSRPVRLYARRTIRRHNPLAALDDAWHRLKLQLGIW